MSYLDKTFCASPNCKNDCGRRMTDKERDGLDYFNEQYVSYGYFCGEPKNDLSSHENDFEEWKNHLESLKNKDGKLDLSKCDVRDFINRSIKEISGNMKNDFKHIPENTGETVSFEFIGKHFDE